VTVRVRPAAPEDADRVADVHVRTWQGAYRHVFAEEGLASLSETLGRRAAHWRATVAEGRPGDHLLVAEVDDVLVGFSFLGASRDDPAEGELYAIYVLPDAWGRGAGRALMDETLRLLRERGHEEAVLWVLEDNPRTRRFYEASGWRSDGAAKEEEFLGTTVREVRYRIAL